MWPLYDRGTTLTQAYKNGTIVREEGRRKTCAAEREGSRFGWGLADGSSKSRGSASGEGAWLLLQVLHSGPSSHTFGECIPDHRLPQASHSLLAPFFDESSANDEFLVMDEIVADRGQRCLAVQRSLAGPQEYTSKSTRRKELELFRPSLFDDHVEFFFSHRHD